MKTRGWVLGREGLHVKVIRRLLLVLCLGMGLFVVSNWQSLVTQVTFYHSAATNLLAQKGSSQKGSNYKSSGYILRNTKDATTKTGANDTPVEVAMQGLLLEKTYVYHFEKGTPAAAQRVFNEAILLYNRTNLVTLKLGDATTKSNQITLGVYHKREAKGQATVEYGHGGPEITQRINWRGIQTTNTATAKLNATYPQSFKRSVAVHELGHALGLDHSTEKASVMYPIDQGIYQLSAADLKSLRAIYEK